MIKQSWDNIPIQAPAKSAEEGNYYITKLYGLDRAMLDEPLPSDPEFQPLVNIFKTFKKLPLEAFEPNSKNMDGVHEVSLLFSNWCVAIVGTLNEVYPSAINCLVLKDRYTLKSFTYRGSSGTYDLIMEYKNKSFNFIYDKNYEEEQMEYESFLLDTKDNYLIPISEELALELIEALKLFMIILQAAQKGS